MPAGNGHHERGDDGGLYEIEDPVGTPPALPGKVVVRPDADELIDSLAADLVIHAENCVREFGDFHVALSGGPTFEALYRRLMYDPNYRRIPWRRAHVWFVEEYCVPFDDVRSRYRMIGELIGDHADIPPEQFHTVFAESESADLDYEAQIRAALEWREKGQDRLDYALLTIDPQGGTAGIAPGTVASAGNGFDAAQPGPAPAGARDPDRLVCVCRSGDAAAPDRISLTLPFLNASRFIAVLVTGARLAGTVQRIAAKAASAEEMPIRGIAPLNGELKWYLDGPACGAAAAT